MDFKANRAMTPGRSARLPGCSRDLLHLSQHTRFSCGSPLLNVQPPHAPIGAVVQSPVWSGFCARRIRRLLADSDELQVS